MRACLQRRVGWGGWWGGGAISKTARFVAQPACYARATAQRSACICARQQIIAAIAQLGERRLKTRRSPTRSRSRHWLFRLATCTPVADRTLAGLELAIFGSENQRLIHLATGFFTYPNSHPRPRGIGPRALKSARERPRERARATDRELRATDRPRGPRASRGPLAYHVTQTTQMFSHRCRQHPVLLAALSFSCAPQTNRTCRIPPPGLEPGSLG